MLTSLFVAAITMGMPAELLGTWVQPCRNQAVREEVFTDQKATLTEAYFSDLRCQDPVMTFVNEGAVVAQNNKMDFTFEKVLLSLHQENLVADFNARFVCGKNDWALHKGQDITGKLCALFGTRASLVPRAGDQRFGIYVLQENRLYFGKLEPGHDALSPEKRPRQLDPRYYLKQDSLLKTGRENHVQAQALAR